MKRPIENSYDIVVVGGGVAGVAAAVAAAGRGMRTALVEKQGVGGNCANSGCAPAKTLLYSAYVNRMMSRIRIFGFAMKSYSYHLGTIVKRGMEISRAIENNMEAELARAGVVFIKGFASLGGNGIVQVVDQSGKKQLKARSIVLATGSRPKALDCATADGKRVWNYANALAPQSIPSSLIIVGGGAIGMEFSGFYNAIGCRVTLIERESRLLPSCDPEISDFMIRSCVDHGMNVFLDSVVQKVEKSAFGVCVHVLGKDGIITKVKAKKVLVACGMQGDTEGLGLENTAVEIARGRIKTDNFCRTDDPSVFAVGDAADGPWLAHKAQNEARICIENISGEKGVKPLNRSLIPQYIYSYPKVAMIGLSQQDAQNAGMKTIIGRGEFKTNTSALIAGNGIGFVKLVFNADTKVLIGAFAISAEVGEVLSACIPCLHKKATIKDMSEMMFAYPMYAEAVSLAVADAARAVGQKPKTGKARV